MIDIQKHLDSNEVFAMNSIVKSMWVDVLRMSLDKNNGCVLEVSEHLGVSRATIISKCYMYSVDPNEYRTVKLRARKSKAEKHKVWFDKISNVLNDKKVSVSEAARNLGWSRSTLYQRMKIVGITR